VLGGTIMDYTSLSVEVLFAVLQKHPSDSPVLEELAQRMRPIIMTEALKYRSQLPFDTDDYMQEGRILLVRFSFNGYSHSQH